jgi:phage tail-like protein
MALAGAAGISLDPVMNHNFLVSLIDTSSSLAKTIAMAAVFDVVVGGFTECSGLEMTLDVEEYREGGRNGQLLVFPKNTKWSHITLRKGVGAGTALWDWSYGFTEGKGKRRDGVIALMNELHLPNNIWYFRRGLPVKYTGPAMNATQNAVAIEAVEIAHEGIFQLPSVGYAAAAASAAITQAV